MPEFLSAHAGTILVAAVLAVMLICIVIKMCKDKKRGCCCGGCAGCPSQGACQAYRNENKDE